MKGVNIFISYAHEDQELLEALEIHLSLLKRQNLVGIWYAHDISRGSEWHSQIDRHLDDAQIILLLISPSFLSSDYSYSLEMKRAMELHANGRVRVIPIVLRSVDWLGTTPFGKLMALPTGGKPVALWRSRDDALLNIAHGLRRVIEQMEVEKSEPSAVNLDKAISGETSNRGNAIARGSAENVTSASDRKRLDYLEHVIRSSYLSIKDAENVIRFSDDSVEKKEAQRSIDLQQNIMKDFLREYMELSNQLGTVAPIDVIQFSSKFSDVGDESDNSYDSIRQALVKTFSLRELRLLGLDLGVDIDTLEGEDTESKVLSLLDYMRRNARMDDVKAYLKRKRPKLFIG